VMAPAMKQFLAPVDQLQYKQKFFQLRNIAKDALVALGAVAGGDESIPFNDIFKANAVSALLRSVQKIGVRLLLNTQFMRANEDIFVLFFDKEAQVLRCRIRKFGDGPSWSEEDTYDEADEEEETFISRVLELLLAYKPPVDQRSERARVVPEALTVPARAVLTQKEQARVKSAGDRHKDRLNLEDGDAGLRLTIVVHPRAPNRNEYMASCAQKLADAIRVDVTEAQQRLLSDEKFAKFFESLLVVEKGSNDDCSTLRTLRARTRILIDSQHVAERVKVTWQEARDAMQDVKWYRWLLGTLLAVADGDQKECSGLQECLDAIVEAWPDVKAVVNPVKQKRAGDWSQGGGDAKRAKKGDGKGKGKHKGKGKGKEKGK